MSLNMVEFQICLVFREGQIGLLPFGKTSVSESNRRSEWSTVFGRTACEWSMMFGP